LSNQEPSNISNGATQGVQLLEIGAHTEMQRLDNFLISKLKGVPKSKIYRVIRKGEVRINKKRAKPDTKLHAGDIVRIPPIRVAQPSVIEPPSASLVTLLESAVLYEDEQVLVINKPQGLAVHRGSGLKIGLIEALRSMRDNGDEAFFLELVHRIDKDTTGCIVIAKNPLFLKYMQREFKERNVHKTYQAIVHGEWPDDIVEVNAPLLKHDVQQAEKVVTVDPEGKSAITHFKLVQRFAQCSFIEANPVTGRTHQIRVHCQYAGHPIVGDRKYTSAASNALGQHKQLCLHAAKIEFTMINGEVFKIEAPLGGAMLELLEKQRSKSL